MVKLSTLIEQGGSSGTRLLEQAIFDSRDAEFVASELESYAASELSEVKDALYYSASVGVVAALRLANGDRVVVKVHRWNVSAQRLRDVQRIQAYMSSHGVPAPRPLAGPTPLGNGLAVIEEMRYGEVANGHEPTIRKALAEGLHAFITSSKALVGRVEIGAPLVLLDRGVELWPEPHDLRFDFEGTSAGAEWIDVFGRQARRRLIDVRGDLSVGHFDWRVQNLGFTDGALSAIYDWDSIAAAPEPVIVGCAAAQFTAVWDKSTRDPLPSLGEMKRFVELYEKTRGEAFTPDERESLDAANLWSCAYGARCQHSDRVSSGGDAEVTDYGQLLRERGEKAFM